MDGWRKDATTREKMRRNGVFVHEYIIDFNLGARAPATPYSGLLPRRQERGATPQAQPSRGHSKTATPCFTINCSLLFLSIEILFFLVMMQNDLHHVSSSSTAVAIVVDTTSSTCTQQRQLRMAVAALQGPPPTVPRSAKGNMIDRFWSLLST